MATEGTIRLARAFCSARDRNVPVLRREGERPTDRAAVAAADVPQLVSCLDYGVRCTGWLCPLFTVPTLPPEELLAEAAQAERDRKSKSIADGRAILERAVKECGQVRKEREARGARRRRSATDTARGGPGGDAADGPHAGPAPAH